MDSQNTDFVMDLNAGLTRVLSNGATTYTYGIGRIAQITGADTEYFLSDALGSVRQLADGGGAISLDRNYGNSQCADNRSIRVLFEGV
jgi:hypothetical protein